MSNSFREPFGEPLPQVLERRVVALGNVRQRRFEGGAVVSVRQQIALVQHIDPKLAVLDDVRRKGLFQDVSGRRWHHPDSGLLHVVQQGLPCQVERVLEAMNRALLLERRELLNTPCDGLVHQRAGAVQIVEALFPPRVGIQRFAPQSLQHRLHDMVSPSTGNAGGRCSGGPFRLARLAGGAQACAHRRAGRRAGPESRQPPHLETTKP
jgi:hypothetical protein